MTSTATATGTRYIAKCKGGRCNGQTFSWVGGTPNRYGKGTKAKACPACGVHNYGTAVKGTYAEAVVCSERCTASASTRCSCSCSGENHGADYGGLR